MNKADQSITFNKLTNRKFEDGDFIPTAIASSELPVTFTSSNTSVAIISGTTITIIGAGTTIITASQPGDSNYNKADEVDQELSIIITGLEDENSKTKIVLFPNPAQDYLYLKGEHIEQISSFSIIDNAGKIIVHQKKIHEHIDVSGLENGLYHIIVEIDNSEIKEKFIIKR